MARPRTSRTCSSPTAASSPPAGPRTRPDHRHPGHPPGRLHRRPDVEERDLIGTRRGGAQQCPAAPHPPSTGSDPAGDVPLSSPGRPGYAQGSWPSDRHNSVILPRIGRRKSQSGARTGPVEERNMADDNEIQPLDDRPTVAARGYPTWVPALLLVLLAAVGAFAWYTYGQVAALGQELAAMTAERDQAAAERVSVRPWWRRRRARGRRWRHAKWSWKGSSARRVRKRSGCRRRQRPQLRRHRPSPLQLRRPLPRQLRPRRLAPARTLRPCPSPQPGRR